MHGDILKIYDDFCLAQNTIGYAKDNVHTIFSNFNSNNGISFPLQWINNVTAASNILCQSVNRAKLLLPSEDEELRTIARDCMENLQNGLPKGIKINKNLTVYTEMPGEEKEYEIDTILQTLLNTYSAVLIDTDFETSYEVFEKVQELYLVQTMDVLTIQPLTAFLRNMQSKGILRQEKLKIVIELDDGTEKTGHTDGGLLNVAKDEVILLSDCFKW